MALGPSRLTTKFRDRRQRQGGGVIGDDGGGNVIATGEAGYAKPSIRLDDVPAFPES